MGNCASLQISCDKALNNTCSSLFGDGNCMHMMEANLEALTMAMQELKERRDDLLTRVVTEEDEGLQRTAQVQKWFSKVQGVESQVNDLLKARSTQTKRLCLGGYCSLNLISGCNYGSKVLKKLNKVEGFLSSGVFEVVAARIPAKKVEKKHIPFTVGLDKKVKKAWNHLFEDGKAKTLGLWGMGGIGKTTLLAGINNKFYEHMSDFDVVIWVVVSKDLQYEGIQEQILRSLDHDKKWEHQTEEERAYEVYIALSGKKFVLLLDDLWSRVDLNKVGVPPVTPQNNSKIVFTSRSHTVCKDMEADQVMEVVRLTKEESWKLFEKQLGYIKVKINPRDFKVPTLVVALCNGLPLAVSVVGRVVGRSMTSKKMNVQECRLVIHGLGSSVREFGGLTQERVLPLLRFGYDRLAQEAKLCFLYCSLFPAGYEIEKDELIEYWICEGLISRYNQGRDIIKLLVSAHLLLIGGPLSVKMHDVVREMALWVTATFGERKEKIFSVKSGVWLHQMPKNIGSEVVSKISLMSNQIAKISCSPNCPELSTLFLQKNKLVDIPGEFFRFMPALAVLDLSDNKDLIGLPEEISNSGCLQYLNLSSTGIKSLPVGMKKLGRLIVLNLDHTLELQSIVVGVVKSMRNLRVLKLYYSGVCIDERLMQELQALEHLKLLSATVEDAAVLESIQRVAPLASTIRSLCLRKMSAPVVTLNAVALDGLKRLAIVDCQISEIKIEWESKKVSDCSGGNDGIHWLRRGVVSPPCFKNLTSITISGLEGPRDLTWLTYAQKLRFLYVMRSQSIEEIINKEESMRISNEHPGIGAPFWKLEHLEVRRLDQVKIICQNPGALLYLTEFLVRCCPKLPLSLRDNMRKK